VSTQGHSPGPWSIRLTHDGRWEVVDQLYCTIAVVEPIEVNGPPDADAKLIGSAPDLAEALKALEDVAGRVAAAVTVEAGRNGTLRGLALLGALADCCTKARLVLRKAGVR
jgi:hypothetical protein